MLKNGTAGTLATIFSGKRTRKKSACLAHDHPFSGVPWTWVLFDATPNPANKHDCSSLLDMLLMIDDQTFTFTCAI
jgi:hypothetical protein